MYASFDLLDMRIQQMNMFCLAIGVHQCREKKTFVLNMFSDFLHQVINERNWQQSKASK